MKSVTISRMVCKEGAVEQPGAHHINPGALYMTRDDAPLVLNYSHELEPLGRAFNFRRLNDSEVWMDITFTEKALELLGIDEDNVKILVEDYDYAFYCAPFECDEDRNVTKALIRSVSMIPFPYKTVRAM